MIDFLSRYRYHFFLILIGMSLLTVINGLFHLDAQGIIYPDSGSYFEAAKNVYVYQIGHNYRPMVMAAINGIPYLFGGTDPDVYVFSYYVNVFCWLLTGLILFEMLKEYVSARMAFLFTLLYFFSIGTIVLIYHLLSENIYTLFIMLVFYFLQRYYQTIRDNQNKTDAKAFLFLSIALSTIVLSVLVRPGCKWLALLFLLYFFNEIKRFYKTKAALLIYGSLFMILIQCAGIRYQFGNFTISYIDSVTYYNYLGSKALAYQQGRHYDMATDPRTHHIFSLEPPQIHEEAQRDLWMQLKTNKKGLLYAYGSDLYDNSISGSYPLSECKDVMGTPHFDFWKQFFFVLSQWQNRILTIMAVLLATFFFFSSFRKEPFFSLMAVYIGYTIATSGISCSQGDRFHLVVFPFVLYLLAKWLSDRKRTA